MQNGLFGIDVSLPATDGVGGTKRVSLEKDKSQDTKQLPTQDVARTFGADVIIGRDAQNKSLPKNDQPVENKTNDDVLTLDKEL